MVTLVCSSCGEFVEVKEIQVLGNGSIAVVRNDSAFSCTSCGRENIIKFKVLCLKKHLNLGDVPIATIDEGVFFF